MDRPYHDRHRQLSLTNIDARASFFYSSKHHSSLSAEVPALSVVILPRELYGFIPGFQCASRISLTCRVAPPLGTSILSPAIPFSSPSSHSSISILTGAQSPMWV